MTEDQRSALKAVGWTSVVPGHWRSPLTGRDFTDREALAMLALKPRTGRTYRPTLYHRR